MKHKNIVEWLAAALRGLGVTLWLATVAGSASAQFKPTEQLVSSQPDLIDAEFSQERAQIVWADSTGKLWVGNVNRQTGMLEPTSGKFQQVDGDALTLLDVLGVTFNGPEWIATASGPKVVYTKFVAGQPHTAGNARLAIVQPNTNGTWSLPKILSPRLPRLAPYASVDVGDAKPRITYVDPFNHHYWREIDSAATEEMIPDMPQNPKSVRFVAGSRAVVYSIVINGVSQVVRYDLDTKLLEQLTFDTGDKDLDSVPWMWAAPEYGGAPVLMSVANRNEMRFYRQLPGADGVTLTWQRFAKRTFGAGDTVWSPEPFTYQGKSYVFTGLITPPNEFSSEIWLVNMNPSVEVKRRLNDNQLLRGRMDPEVFVTANGPYIYYNRFDSTKVPGQPFCSTCSEGLYRAHTGLAAPQ